MNLKRLNKKPEVQRRATLLRKKTSYLRKNYNKQMEKFTTVSSQEKGSQDQAVNSGEACANTVQ